MMSRIGSDVEQAARTNAPVRTGALSASIHNELEPENGEPGTIVYADVPYAAFVEFGTYKDAPQPYLRPAMEEVVS